MKALSGLLFVAILTLNSCHRVDKSETFADDQPCDTIVIKEPVLVGHSHDNDNEHLVLGTLYHQQGAEYRALCYQAFNMGKLLLDIDLKDKSIDKHRIIVLDVDETVLDNSPYQAQCIIDNVNYPRLWDEWCNKASADPIPGSLEFLKYARSNGVSVFYITNRKEHLKQVTIDNLKKHGFPHAEDDHVFMRTDENSKESRRDKLLEKYHISLFFGDNLNDFSNVFEEKLNAPRAVEVDKLRDQFGSRFIVLPNSMYGEWELALYDYQQKHSDSTKKLLRHKGLQGF